MRLLAIILVFLISLAAVIGVIAGFAYSGTSYRTPGQQRITMDHIFNGTFYSSQPDLNWVAEGTWKLLSSERCLPHIIPLAGDGVFSLSEGGYIKLVDLKSNTTRNLLAYENVKDVGTTLQRI